MAASIRELRRSCAVIAPELRRNCAAYREYIEKYGATATSAEPIASTSASPRRTSAAASKRE